MEACGGDLKEKLLKLFEILFMSPRVRPLSVLVLSHDYAPPSPVG